MEETLALLLEEGRDSWCQASGDHVLGEEPVVCLTLVQAVCTSEVFNQPVIAEL